VVHGRSGEAVFCWAFVKMNRVLTQVIDDNQVRRSDVRIGRYQDVRFFAAGNIFWLGYGCGRTRNRLFCKWVATAIGQCYRLV